MPNTITDRAKDNMPSQKYRRGNDPRRGNELLNACYFGNTSDALKLLAAGADAHFVDTRDGWAGIHYAARWGRTKIIEALMQAGVDINVRTTGKENALHKACRSNRKDTTIWLLLHGADPNVRNGNGERPSDLTLCDTCKYICEHFQSFLTRWQSMGKDIKPLRQNKTTVSKTSCDVTYDVNWEVMSSDISKAQAFALRELTGRSPSKGRGSISSPRAITDSSGATRATEEMKRLRSLSPNRRRSSSSRK